VVVLAGRAEVDGGASLAAHSIEGRTWDNPSQTSFIAPSEHENLMCVYKSSYLLPATALTLPTASRRP